jgi:hypothetical protein
VSSDPLPAGGYGRYLAAIGINAQMQRSPATAGSDAVLFLQPLAFAVNLQTDTVHQNMQRSVRSNLTIGPFSRRLPGSCPTAQVGMIRDSERKPYQLQHRFQQALCLSQPWTKHQA